MPNVPPTPLTSHDPQPQPKPSTAAMLRRARLAHDLSLDELAHLLDTSRQRLHQFEGGQPIPPERLMAWATNDSLPRWVRELAYQLRILQLEQSFAALAGQLAQLKHAAPLAA